MSYDAGSEAKKLTAAQPCSPHPDCRWCGRRRDRETSGQSADRCSPGNQSDATIEPVKRSGIADLPLHGGRVPAWLATRMTTLGTAIAESVIHHYGRSALLSRLSDPFWFQALGAVMGMDWHSSGITTSVVGALKRGMNPRAAELGIHFCGGRGRHSRNTPK